MLQIFQKIKSATFWILRYAIGHKIISSVILIVLIVAGYYGYKWAEVLDADAFSYFTETGIFNKNTADSFRKNILERGGTDDAMKLYRQFTKGKEPSVQPLLERRGLK